MTFYGMLSERPGAAASASRQTSAPDFFVDLNLDQVVDAITAGYQEYDLKPVFYTSLTDADMVRYRHEIMQDLEQASLLEHIKQFAANMRAMRQHLSQVEKLHYRYQKEAWFLDAVESYCGAVEALVRDLLAADLRSRGFLAFRQYLLDYAGSHGFTSLAAKTRQLKEDLAAVRYCLLIKDGSIRAHRYNAETDYSAEIEAVFARFKQSAVKSYLIDFPASDDMNHVEAAVVELVAKLHADLFQQLDTYRAEHANYVDEIIQNFDREIHFYVSYLAYIAPLKHAGLCFCYPAVSSTSKEMHVRDGFDLALARKLIPEGTPIVCNDFHLEGPGADLRRLRAEPGRQDDLRPDLRAAPLPRQPRLPGPGPEARLFLFDRLFTHFEREEDITTLRGKLEDDLVRIHGILGEATPRSIIVMNEIFTSTTLQDAVFLSQAIMRAGGSPRSPVRLGDLHRGAGPLSEKAVSMVSTIVPGDPASRTYRIVREPADGACLRAGHRREARSHLRPSCRERLAS